MSKPDFAESAFQKAFIERAEHEERAFDEFFDNRGRNAMLTAIRSAGIDEMGKIFDVVNKIGLEPAMHRYELALMSLAFHEGMNAPRMEDIKQADNK